MTYGVKLIPLYTSRLGASFRVKPFNMTGEIQNLLTNDIMLKAWFGIEYYKLVFAVRLELRQIVQKRDLLLDSGRLDC